MAVYQRAVVAVDKTDKMAVFNIYLKRMGTLALCLKFAFRRYAYVGVLSTFWFHIVLCVGFTHNQGKICVAFSKYVDVFFAK